MEKFRDFFTLRPSDLNTVLTYVLLDNFCPCLLSTLKSIQFYAIQSSNLQRVAWLFLHSILSLSNLKCSMANQTLLRNPFAKTKSFSLVVCKKTDLQQLFGNIYKKKGSQNISRKYGVQKSCKNQLFANHQSKKRYFANEFHRISPCYIQGLIG